MQVPNPAKAFLLAAFMTATATAFNITTLRSSPKDPSAPQNATITFTVCDDSDPSLASANCQLSWLASAAPPTEPVPCDNPAFEWEVGPMEDAPEVQGYVDAGEFGLSVQHAYHDASIDSNPSENFVTKFANANVNGTVVAPDGVDFVLEPGIRLAVPIYGETL